jgi:hypothetical protein
MRVSYDPLQAQFDDVHDMFANIGDLQIQTSFTRSSLEPVRLQVSADCSHTHFMMMMEEVEYMTRCQANHRTDVAIYLHLATSRHHNLYTRDPVGRLRNLAQLHRPLQIYTSCATRRSAPNPKPGY